MNEFKTLMFVYQIRLARRKTGENRVGASSCSIGLKHELFNRRIIWPLVGRLPNLFLSFTAYVYVFFSPFSLLLSMRKTSALRVEVNAICKMQYAKCEIRYTNAKHGTCLINMLICIACHYLKNVKNVKNELKLF